MALLNFNFRIEKDLKKRLEVLQSRYKDRYSNLSDLARDLLDESLHSQLKEFDDLAPDLRIIGQKIEQDNPLSHSEIRFLCDEAHIAYRSYHSNDFINRHYLLDVVSVFESIMPLIYLDNDVKNGLAKYLISLPEQQPHQFHSFINDKIKATKRYILESENAPNAEYIARLLPGLTIEAQFYHININDLNEAIKPYKMTLLKLVKKRYWLDNKKPMFHFVSEELFDKNSLGVKDRGLITDFDKPYEDGVFKLRVMTQTNLSAILSLFQSPDNERAVIGMSFPMLNDLIKLVDILNKTYMSEVYQFTGEYFSALYLKSGCALSTPDCRFYLSHEEIESLKKVVNAFAEEKQSELEALRVQWGDI